MDPQAQALRRLINGGEHFIAADAYSALTGRIVERVGFKAAYLGGHACSAFHYALPDCGVFSQVEQIEQAGRIAAAITIPLIADADTLGETVADAFHFTRRYARAGVAGIHVEDEVNPKHSSYAHGLLPVAEMQARLAACIEGRGESSLVVIARCDEFMTAARRGGGGGDLDEAIARGKAYLATGADLLVFPGADAPALTILLAALDAPIAVLGPSLPGAAFTMHTGWGWTGAAQLHLERAQELFASGRLHVDPGFDGKTELLDQDRFDRLVRDWAMRTGRPVR